MMQGNPSCNGQKPTIFLFLLGRKREVGVFNFRRGEVEKKLFPLYKQQTNEKKATD